MRDWTLVAVTRRAMTEADQRRPGFSFGARPKHAGDRAPRSVDGELPHRRAFDLAAIEPFKLSVVRGHAVAPKFARGWIVFPWSGWVNKEAGASNHLTGGL